MKKHIGGITGSVESLATGLVEAAQREVGHVDTTELRAVCRLVLRRLREVAPECPCSCGSEEWHLAGVCREGVKVLEARELQGVPETPERIKP